MQDALLLARNNLESLRILVITHFDCMERVHKEMKAPVALFFYSAIIPSQCTCFVWRSLSPHASIFLCSNWWCSCLIHRSCPMHLCSKHRGCTDFSSSFLQLQRTSAFCFRWNHAVWQRDLVLYHVAAPFTSWLWQWWMKEGSRRWSGVQASNLVASSLSCRFFVHHLQVFDIRSRWVRVNYFGFESAGRVGNTLPSWVVSSSIPSLSLQQEPALKPTKVLPY